MRRSPATSGEWGLCDERTVVGCVGQRQVAGGVDADDDQHAVVHRRSDDEVGALAEGQAGRAIRRLGGRRLIVGLPRSCVLDDRRLGGVRGLDSDLAA